MRPVLSAFLAFCIAPPALAQAIAPQPQHWSVAPEFARDASARKNISAAACVPTTPPFRSCLAINDQKRYAQFFSISGNTIVPGAVLTVLGGDADGDPDAEAAAYHRGYFYFAGSHGRARKSGKLKNTPFTVFRFKVDPQNGKPAFEVSDRHVPPQIEKSTALRAALRNAEFVGPFAEKLLEENGANIEGMALDGDRIYFGLRGPVLEGRAFVVSTAIDGMFGIKPLEAKTHALALGAQAGIRDMAASEDGILVLSGPVNEQSVTPAVWRWKPSSGELKKLGDLAETPPGAKAETLLLLGQTPEQYRVLVMHDGPDNGAPMEYRLPRE